MGVVFGGFLTSVAELFGRQVLLVGLGVCCRVGEGVLLRGKLLIAGQGTCLVDPVHIIVLFFIIGPILHTTNKPDPVIHQLTRPKGKVPLFFFFILINPLHNHSRYLAFQGRAFKCFDFTDHDFLLNLICGDFLEVGVGEIPVGDFGEVGEGFALDVEEEEALVVEEACGGLLVGDVVEVGGFL